MFELIVIIIIIAWIVNTKKKRDGISNGPRGNIQLPNTTITTAAPEKRSMESRYSGNSAYAGATPVETNASGSGGIRQRRPVRHVAAQSAIEEAKEDGNSTTAYLMEKAEADAREHAREKYEEQKRLHEAKGGLAVAERLYDGDSVPQGKRCVICGYCAAENLVPMVPRTRYSCYFCREPL